MAQLAKWSDFSELDGAALAERLLQRLPAIVTVLLIVLLGWQLARVVWLLVPGSAAGDPVTVAAPMPTAGSGGSGVAPVNVERIASAHLFGEARESDAPEALPVTPTEDLQETRLALTLKGTMAGSSDRLTRAIIADNRNDEKVYTVGDVVAPGATLHAVYRDQVVLNRGGVLEALKLPKDMPTGSAPLRRQPSTRVAVPTGEATESIQGVLTENASRLADVIRPTPYFVGGQQQGYRVYPGRNRQQFAALGLRPGDLIKDIDGQALTDPQQAMEIFQNLGSADQVSVTVERNGQPEVLVLTTSQLQLDDNPEQ
ncbi:MAG: type II secretion system protein GspC [Woeseiaceae bacterium]|nr:type II secretion system protein GspC [Woeseiaceae bacterium]